ncbi:MAG: hypothetical protein FWD74_10545, partial [Actinomycetia bacterium]|nr:hypothetical protein [Actinomycetes bacterium]
ALVGPLQGDLAMLKRLNVIKQNADLSAVTGTKVAARNLTFAPTPDRINDNVEVVKLTGGTITVNADLARVPFTDALLKAVAPNGLPAGSSAETTIDLGELIAGQNDGQPIRLAAQRVGDKWYPSLFYTIADNAARASGLTTLGDPIPADGSSSPADAVQQTVDALLASDYRKLIGLMPPTEMAVLHDYGSLILQSAAQDPTVTALPFEITNLDLASASGSGGTARVTLRGVTVKTTDPPAQTYTVSVENSCAKIALPGGSGMTYCADDAIAQLAKLPGVKLTPEQRTAVTHLVTGLADLNLTTVQDGGKWYVDPVRSYLDISHGPLSALSGNDLVELLPAVPNLIDALLFGQMYSSGSESTVPAGPDFSVSGPLTSDASIRSAINELVEPVFDGTVPKTVTYVRTTFGLVNDPYFTPFWPVDATADTPVVLIAATGDFSSIGPSGQMLVMLNATTGDVLSAGMPEEGDMQTLANYGQATTIQCAADHC